MTKTTDMSVDAVQALIGAGTNRQGAAVQAVRDSAVWDELKSAGLIGPGGGLTRKGTIVRQREMDRKMDDLFSL